MKILSIISLYTAIWFCSTSSAQEVKVGIVESPPHVIVEQETVKGPLISYLRNALSNSNYAIQFIPLPAKRADWELKRGRLDFVLPVTKQQGVLRYIEIPLFYSVPGLCFKKNNFVPLLSSSLMYEKMHIGIPAGTNIVESLQLTFNDTTWINGTDVMERGLNLLARDRIDALYHPSPIEVYHYTNPLSKDIACSYFHGYSTGNYIAYSPYISETVINTLKDTIAKKMSNHTYEYFYATLTH